MNLKLQLLFKEKRLQNHIYSWIVTHFEVYFSKFWDFMNTSFPHLNTLRGLVLTCPTNPSALQGTRGKVIRPKFRPIAERHRRTMTTFQWHQNVSTEHSWQFKKPLSTSVDFVVLLIRCVRPCTFKVDNMIG